MSYVVMARKWRPQKFEDVVGQSHVVRTLKNAIQANRISHAYLFTGPRGVGKTTTARLLAKAINCLAPEAGEPCNHCVRCEEIMSGASTDVMEIDAASSGLVDDARELREKVRYAPLTCRYKVMIIDEVHMMSNAAFNALLKTLEEPPAHTVFILATTESHKVPATIISRCQRFDFRRIAVREIVDRLSVMAGSEGVTVEDDALHVIARGADGSLRDAQSLFDQVVSFSGERIQSADVVTVLGLVETQVGIDLVDAVAKRQTAAALDIIDRLVNAGVDLKLFMKDWVEYWRSLVVAQVVPKARETLLNLSGPVLEAVERQALLFPLQELTQLAKWIAATDDELRRTLHPRVVLELLLVQLCSAERMVSLESLWHQVHDLEVRLAKVPAVGLSPVQSAPVSDEAPGTSVLPPEPAPIEAGEPALVVDALEDLPPATPLDQVRRVWAQILQSVGQQNRRVQALLRDAEVSAADEGWVEITCVSVYHRTGLEKEETRKLIEQTLDTVLGRRTRLRIRSNAQPENEAKENPSRAQEFDEIVRKEPLVQKTLEMFGGHVVDVIGRNSKPPQP